jgi:hypothetical protein
LKQLQASKESPAKISLEAASAKEVEKKKFMEVTSFFVPISSFTILTVPYSYVQVTNCINNFFLI